MNPLGHSPTEEQFMSILINKVFPGQYYKIFGMTGDTLLA